MNSVPAALPSPSSRNARPLVPASDGTRSVEIAYIDAFTRLEDATPVWERLSALDSVMTPCSDLDWIAAWQRRVGTTQGLEPLIVVARDEFDAPLLLLPFAVRRGRHVTVAQYFGGTHSHLNLGVWRRDVAAAITAEQLRSVLGDIARRSGIDVFMLRNQPLSWDGCDNPFARLPHQRGSDDVYRLEFNGGSGEQVIKTRLKSNMRGLLKNKERKLAKLDGYRYVRAATAAEADHILDAFFVQKAAQFAARGIRDVFSEPGINEFLRDACKTGLAEGHPAIELHAIEGGGEILAILGGVAGRRRFASMFNSYTLTEHGRWSPGLVIITHVIRSCADRGLASFDLGVGFAQYKWFFCKDIDPLFDSFLPFSTTGRLAAMACRSAFSLKRWLKTMPRVWNALQTVRRALG